MSIRSAIALCLAISLCLVPGTALGDEPLFDGQSSGSSCTGLNEKCSSTIDLEFEAGSVSIEQRVMTPLAGWAPGTGLASAAGDLIASVPIAPGVSGQVKVRIKGRFDALTRSTSIYADQTLRPKFRIDLELELRHLPCGCSSATHRRIVRGPVDTSLVVELESALALPSSPMAAPIEVIVRLHAATEVGSTLPEAGEATLSFIGAFTEIELIAAPR